MYLIWIIFILPTIFYLFLSVALVFAHPVILLINNPYTLLLLNPFIAPWRAQAGLIGLASLF